MRAQPLINCRDVRASSRWYQRLLGCVGGHGGDEYERLWDPKLHTSKWGSDGLILQLHAWDVDHHHGSMGDPSRDVGNGMLLWFEVDDFDAAVARARNMALPEYLAGGGRVFRATRDSDVVGPDLVAAATEYVATVRQALELARARYPQVSSPADVAWAEYNLAEAEYFLEEAKTRR